MTSTKAQLGRAVAASLFKGEETASRYLFVTSWVATQNEVVEACEKVTGTRSKLSQVSSEQRLEEGKKLLA